MERIYGERVMRKNVIIVIFISLLCLFFTWNCAIQEQISMKNIDNNNGEFMLCSKYGVGGNEDYDTTSQDTVKNMEEFLSALHESDVSYYDLSSIGVEIEEESINAVIIDNNLIEKCQLDHQIESGEIFHAPYYVDFQKDTLIPIIVGSNIKKEVGEVIATELLGYPVKFEVVGVFNNDAKYSMGIWEQSTNDNIFIPELRFENANLIGEELTWANQILYFECQGYVSYSKNMSYEKSAEILDDIYETYNVKWGYEDKIENKFSDVDLLLSDTQARVILAFVIVVFLICSIFLYNNKKEKNPLYIKEITNYARTNMIRMIVLYGCVIFAGYILVRNTIFNSIFLEEKADVLLVLIIYYVLELVLYDRKVKREVA